ncbi:PREDICTED: cilia- and flagella-associated protein 58-like [Vollenhovia emeryi]|uniref:cilia- and flagella-associated protein 58-like n=1 Tax=Vollenhovia emeryi TaxID=411798 RepID=UPI0005F45472|nr:PREDICTED: cilia- and flagella-associated protein 58-like [Vollenhovia emeryi]
MMDMEMNADLDGDDGSESSQPSSEGSSASSTFCTLEKDYARITNEMSSNEALAPFKDEYERLYESLYKAHRSEKELSGQCTLLKNEIVDNTYKIYELKNTVEAYEDEITRLKEEVTKMTKLADAAHTREQNAQEVIGNLRLNITKLGLEIEEKNKQLVVEKDTTISKKKENLLKEREILIGEMETMRQRMKNMTIYTQELEKKSSEIEQRMTDMQDMIGMQLNEISREKRSRERAETEVQQLQEELVLKKNELETANASIQASANNIMRLESLIRDQKITDEKKQKEMSKLKVKNINLQTDFDNATAEVEKLEKQLSDKEKQMRNMKYQLNRTREDSAKYKHEKDLIDKQLMKAESEQSRLGRELKQALINVRNAEHVVQTCRKEQLEDKQRVEILLREKDTIARNKETAYKRIKRLNHELLLCEQGRKKIEQELDTQTKTIDEMKNQIEVVEKERDRYSSTVHGLEKQLENYISETKRKQTEIFDYKKRLADTEIKYRQHQSVLEAIRMERNLCNRNLVEAQEEIRDLKSKLKITSQQIEQLKEDIAMKEANLVKEEFLLGRAEKEKEELKIDLRVSRMEISNLRQQIEEAKKKEKGLRQAMQQADIDIGRRKKDIDNVMNERDILGTQLVRRNDELGLQYSRIKVLNRTLQCGEIQYNQRLEDIRLLKFEVKRLRTEKLLLSKNVLNVSDLRQEVFYLNRNLAKEKLKITALEEEIQTPLNIHRWRKLEGTDPPAFELIKKVQILQKRILQLSFDMLDKDRKLKDTEKLYMNLREVLSKQSNSQLTTNLNMVQNFLRKRGEKIKCLIAELNMYESQVGGYKEDAVSMANEMYELKNMFYTQKRKLQKIKETTLKSTYPTNFPDILISNKKFYGGGFKIAKPTPKICCIVDTSSNR